MELTATRDLKFKLWRAYLFDKHDENLYLPIPIGMPKLVNAKSPGILFRRLISPNREEAECTTEDNKRRVVI